MSRLCQVRLSTDRCHAEKNSLEGNNELLCAESKLHMMPTLNMQERRSSLKSAELSAWELSACRRGVKETTAGSEGKAGNPLSLQRSGQGQELTKGNEYGLDR